MNGLSGLLIVIDPSSGVPVYRQLMDQVKLLVAGGMLDPGAEMPSTRALSAELGVNPMTISKAYGYLEREGILERRPGRPLVVKAVESGLMRDRKMDRLRASLSEAVKTVRQLGIPKNEATAAFERLLEDGEPRGGRGEGS